MNASRSSRATANSARARRGTLRVRTIVVYIFSRTASEPNRTRTWRVNPSRGNPTGRSRGYAGNPRTTAPAQTRTPRTLHAALGACRVRQRALVDLALQVLRERALTN